LIAFDGLLQSSEQGIARQNYVGSGIGRFLMNTNRATIAVLGGFAWQNTVYNPTLLPIPTQNVATTLISTDVNLFKFNKTSLDLNAVLLPALSQPGRVVFFHERDLLHQAHGQRLVEFLVLW